jgi:hypothetical protein
VTDTPTFTYTITNTPTSSYTITDTPTDSITPTASLTATPSATLTLTSTYTKTYTPTVTDTPTSTYTITDTPSPTSTFSTTASPTASPSVTEIPTRTKTPESGLGLFLNTNQFDIYSGSALTVTYILPATGNIKLFIINVRGNVVHHLCEGTVSMGRHTQTWYGLDEEGQKVNSGLYLVALRYNDETIIKKFVAIRH